MSDLAADHPASNFGHHGGHGEQRCKRCRESGVTRCRGKPREFKMPGRGNTIWSAAVPGRFVGHGRIAQQSARGLAQSIKFLRPCGDLYDLRAMRWGRAGDGFGVRLEDAGGPNPCDSPSAEKAQEQRRGRIFTGHRHKSPALLDRSTGHFSSGQCCEVSISSAGTRDGVHNDSCKDASNETCIHE